MKRREFIAALGGAALWSFAAGAQQRSSSPRIGILSGFANDGENDVRMVPFREALRDLGWIEGRNITLDYRQSNDPARLDGIAQELVASKPDVILAMPTPAMQAIARATRSIPVVFGNVSDPVEGGFVDSLARPGGNVTGFTAFEYSLGGKWLEILREFAPDTRRVLVVYVHSMYTSRGLLRSIEDAGAILRIPVRPAAVQNAGDIARAIEAFVHEGGGGGLITLPHPITANNARVIVDLAGTHRLPAVYPFRHFARTGGVVAYGTVEAEAYRRAAGYVDRILKGAKPGELPVQNPIKFELVVNLKAARAIGLEMPSSFLLRADEVIE